VGGILRAEAVQKHAQLLHVQGVERQQLLDGVDHGHGIGLDLLVRRAGWLRQIIHPGGKGRLPRDPSRDAEALQTLDQDLELSVLLVHPVDSAGGADGVEVPCARLLGCLRVDQYDAENLVLGLADGLEGRRPSLGVHQQGHGLAREEGSRRHRQQVYQSRKDLIRPGEGARIRLLEFQRVFSGFVHR